MWGHRPTAPELLADRLAHGWTPTPSRLKGGDRVLGFAACAVEAMGGANGAESRE